MCARDYSAGHLIVCCHYCRHSNDDHHPLGMLKYADAHLAPPRSWDERKGDLHRLREQVSLAPVPCLERAAAQFPVPGESFPHFWSVLHMILAQVLNHTQGLLHLALDSPVRTEAAPASWRVLGPSRPPIHKKVHPSLLMVLGKFWGSQNAG